jgi:hypothetical protein
VISDAHHIKRCTRLVVFCGPEGYYTNGTEAAESLALADLYEASTGTDVIKSDQDQWADSMLVT